ncbi:MAG TPA: VWA domain-containing protein [Fimbriimonadaceae bacterium]|nr:VWA domain-containing protein [Fimbriimonadaceae bacterium]
MEEALRQAFLECKEDGLNIGIEELMDAERLLASDEALQRRIARIGMLWSKRAGEQARAEAILTRRLTPEPRSEPPPPAEPAPRTEPRSEAAGVETPPEPPKTLEPPPDDPQGRKPIETPQRGLVLPAKVTGRTGLEARVSGEAVFPLNERQMRYAWRQLHRVVADGPPDQLDLSATAERWARLGALDVPVYRRRERNRTHLVVLIDQTGSMAPFHRFTRLLAESTSEERLAGRAEVYYFKNTPDLFLREGQLRGLVFRDPRLIQSIPISEALARCTDHSSLIVVSDGGAARRVFSEDRQAAVIRFLAAASSLTRKVVWLNPLPPERWAESTAMVIDALVPMFPMEPSGLQSAVANLRRAEPGRRRW